MAPHVSHDDSVCFTWWLSMFPMMVQFVTYDESACFQRWLSMFLMMAHNFSHWLFNLNHVSNWASASFSWWLSMFSMMAQLVSHDGSACFPWWLSMFHMMAQHVYHDDSASLPWCCSLFLLMAQNVYHDGSACFLWCLSIFSTIAHHFSHRFLILFTMEPQHVSHDGSADAWVRSLAQTVLFQCFCIIYLIFYFTARGRCFVWQYMYVHCHNNNSIIFLSQKICAQTNTHPSHNITFMLTALACNNSSTPGQLPVVAVVAEVPFIWHSV